MKDIEKQIKQSSEDLEDDLMFLTNAFARSYEKKAVDALEMYFNSYAAEVERYLQAASNESQNHSADPDQPEAWSEISMDIISSAIEFRSSVDMLARITKVKKKRLRRHIARMLLRRHSLSESALSLWKSRGKWAVEMFANAGVDMSGWHYEYIDVKYPDYR